MFKMIHNSKQHSTISFSKIVSMMQVWRGWCSPNTWRADV